MPVDEINTLVGEFVNVMHKHGHGSGKLINPRNDYYYVVIGKSPGLLHDEITIHFSQDDVSTILSYSDIIVIMLREE
jgi:hypothetical protein